VVAGVRLCHPQRVTASTGDRRPAGLAPDLEIAPEAGEDDALVRRLRLARRVLAASLVVLAAIVAWLLVDGGVEPLDVVLGGAVLVLVLTLYVQHVTRLALARHRQEREASIRRLVQGLSRSLSPDSVVDTVIADLRAATDADHVVVARVSQPDEVVEVTLAAARADAPPSRTYLRPEPEATARPTGDAPGEVERPGDGVGAAGEAPDAAAEAAEEIARRVRSAYGLSHTLATPVVSGRRFLGALLLARRSRDAWREGDRRLLAWAAEEVGTAFSRAYALEAAERGAKIDALTGLPNRRYFDEVLSIERPRRRANDSLGILMIDIDRFKRLNDRYGHATGDRVLRAVAGAIAAGVRAEDTPARYGGEEFAVLLRRASAEQAIEVGERIRRAVVGLQPASLGIDEPVSVSIGVAVAGRDQVAIPGLVERADQALYRAKRLGRDRVVAA
jgi:diguanylate cyclase (GGDEF)-like protein